MPFADVNGARLFYTDDGAGGPPLLLVHGWTCDSHDWSWQIDAFSETHRVIAVDLRGHGRSSVENDYSFTTQAADLAALLDMLDTGPAVVIGHSLGGAVASVLAVEHPSVVRAVVGVDPAVGIGPELADVADAVARSMSGPGANEFLVGAWVGMEGPAATAGLRTWHRRRALGMPWEFLADTWKAQVDSGVMFRPAADEYLARRDCPVLSIYCDPERAEWETPLFGHPGRLKTPPRPNSIKSLPRSPFSSSTTAPTSSG
jgi:pimeloyl-ACP methyl ester carboxylesterase